MGNLTPLAIVVVGASGDLARKKILPALFALYCQGFLPKDFRVFGFARSPHNDDSFRELAGANLTCRYTPDASCADRMDEFLGHCHYVAGAYDSTDAFLDLYRVMETHGVGPGSNRLFYLAIPPSIFLDVARAIGSAGLAGCGENDPWTRVVIEKPFGHDRASSDTLTQELANVFLERDTYRIDHYLGKEVIQNLMVLRFANLIFEPLWNRNYIERVDVAWKEDIGVEGRGGYFDHYGVIRDVMQNHLLQIVALTAMEPPTSRDARRVRDRKVELLQCVAPLSRGDLVVGQYTGLIRGGVRVPGYRDDETVPDDSVTPTYAAARLQIHNARWEGVPFTVCAGKGLDARMTEVRIRFKAVPANMFCAEGLCPDQNELVIRVQPEESIRFRIANKVPGVGMEIASTNLNLQYEAAFDALIPDAYEDLILDVIRGEKSLFIRDDELQAAWDIFTPVLHELERSKTEPESYVFGSSGPDAGAALLSRL